MKPSLWTLPGEKLGKRGSWNSSSWTVIKKLTWMNLFHTLVICGLRKSFLAGYITNLHAVRYAVAFIQFESFFCRSSNYCMDTSLIDSDGEESDRSKEASDGESDVSRPIRSNRKTPSRHAKRWIVDHCIATHVYRDKANAFLDCFLYWYPWITGLTVW